MQNDFLKLFGRQPISSLGLVELYSPKNQAESIYRDDAVFFAANPTRMRVIRAARGSEFGILDSTRYYQGGMLTPPKLWVMVERRSQGNHLVLPIWRGSAMFPVDTTTDACYCTVNTDDAIDLLFSQLHAENGVNQFELVAYATKLSECIAAETQQRNGSVN